MTPSLKGKIAFQLVQCAGTAADRKFSPVCGPPYYRQQTDNTERSGAQARLPWAPKEHIQVQPLWVHLIGTAYILVSYPDATRRGGEVRQ